jgi:hypothetical protein
MTTDKTYWTNTNGERHIATGNDLKEILDSIAQLEAKKEAEEIALAEKAAQKAALLDRLGLTQEEFNTLTA